jgi:hypothetical protein
MVVTIKSDIMESRGNSWNFEHAKERIYAKLTDPTEAEVEEALREANEQYENMGWSKCYATKPRAVEKIIVFTPIREA